MEKTRGTLGLVSVLMTAVLFLGGCVTVTNAPIKAPLVMSNEYFDSELELTKRKWVELKVSNKTEKIITILVDSSAFNDSRGNNVKLVPEGTLYIDSTRSQPVIVIPPKSRLVKTFFSAIHSKYSGKKGWVTKSWIPANLNGCSFIFGYKVDNKEDFIHFSGDTKEMYDRSEKKTEGTIVGNIEARKKIVNMFFAKSVEERRDELYQLAEKKAQEKYGNNSKLVNIHYKGNWNFMSIFLLGSTIGWVESTKINADVIQ